MTMKERFLDCLDLHRARDCGDHIELELPVVLDFNHHLLTLQIVPLGEEQGYYVLDDGMAFCDDTCGAAHYFERFEREDKHYHYGIGVSEECFFKQYPADFSVRVAVSEFIRFFVCFDDFMLRLE